MVGHTAVNQEDDGATVLIIGGGIGGLAAARSLHRAGIPVRVFERAPQLQEVGAGLGLWMNAIRVLDRLGVGQEIRRIGAPLTVTEVCSDRAVVLSRLDLHDVLSGSGAANYVVHRADLHAALARTLPRDILHTASECVGVRQDARGVEAHFADGPPVRGAALIGADGIRSVVRATLWGDNAPRYSGQTCYRGVSRLSVPDPHVLREVQGHGKRAAVCPLGGDRVYWWAAVNAPAGESDDPAARRQHLLEHFRGWPYLVPEAIERSEAPILRNDLVDRVPLRRWSKGRITLLGDAAHPMLPNLGQGACTAIEDGLVLARAIAVHGPSEQALKAYEGERIGRTSRIVRESWNFGVPVHWRSGWAVRLREALIRSVPTPVLARAIRRHVDFDAGPLPDRSVA